jgi:serine protease inhibitor
VARSSLDFTRKLYKRLAATTETPNLVFSPATVYSCLAMLMMGADGQTLEQVRAALQLTDDEDVLGEGEFLLQSFLWSHGGNCHELDH